MRRRLGGAALALVIAAGAASCGSSSTPRLTVFAAASLTHVFPPIDPHARYSFGGSNDLATQIQQGAPVDVFASADTKLPEQLYRHGLVEKPVVFTENELVLVVPRANPAGIGGVGGLDRPGIKPVMGAAGAPVGDYTRTVLAKLGLSRLVNRAVSQETDVREVLTKVALGEADAGFVYATDAKTVAGKVAVLELPARAQPTVEYAAAAVKSSSQLGAAEAWVHALGQGPAQKHLRAAGFLPLAR